MPGGTDGPALRRRRQIGDHRRQWAAGTADVEALDVGDRAIAIGPPLAVPGGTDHQQRTAPCRNTVPRGDEHQCTHVGSIPQRGVAGHVTHPAHDQLTDSPLTGHGDEPLHIDQ